ncbi:MAG: hypothetical protein IPH89_02585 [Bacteroidetes bacterium]|nr:hypothetical protein [Bacteroidota bacterium]
MVRNSLCVIVLLFSLISCGNNESSELSRIHEIIDSLNIKNKKEIILYRVNPNDCFSCLNGLASAVRSVNEKNITQIFFIKVEREIEKKSINFDFVKPDKNNVFVWSAALFNEVGSVSNFNQPVSTFHCYDYSIDTIIFSSKIKELYRADEFMKIIN